MTKTVRATKPGIYGRYREPGEVFEIAETRHFSSNWMENAPVSARLRAKPKSGEAPATQAEQSGGLAKA
jgi:hypothetical protein